MSNKGRSKCKKAIPVSQVLQDFIKSKGLTDELEKNKHFACWRDVVGDIIADNVQPFKLVDKEMWVETTSSSWMQQFQLIAPMIAKKYNEHFGEDVVRSFKIRMEKKRRGKPVPTRNRHVEDKRCLDIEISAKGVDYIDRVLSPIEDEGIREKMRLLFFRQAQVIKKSRQR